MPNRIIKESICTSDTVDTLTWFEEVFFYRLIVTVDDFGRMDARPAILRSRMFPLKTITDKQINDALNKLATVGIVQIYEWENRTYLQLVTWENHQRIRNQKSKFPAPPDNPLSIDSKLLTNVAVIQSNPNPIRIQNPESEYKSGAEAPDSQALISLTLNNKAEYPIFEDQLNTWLELYPAVDVMQELRKMKGWLDANPTKRKTEKGIMRFINGWLAKQQDKGHTHLPKQQSSNPFLDMAKEMEADERFRDS